MKKNTLFVQHVDKRKKKLQDTIVYTLLSDMITAISAKEVFLSNQQQKKKDLVIKLLVMVVAWYQWLLKIL